MPPENRRRRQSRSRGPDQSTWSPEERAEYDRAERLKTPLADLPGISVRAVNTLEDHNIITLGALVVLKYADLAQIQNFGENTLAEVKKTIEEDLGIPLPHWKKPRPPRRRRRTTKRKK